MTYDAIVAILAAAFITIYFLTYFFFAADIFIFFFFFHTPSMLSFLFRFGLRVSSDA